MAVVAATLTARIIGPNALGSLVDVVAALQAAGADGDAFVCQGKESLVVFNDSGSDVTVTVKSVANNFGVVQTGNDIVKTIADGKMGIIGPLQAAKYAGAGQLAQIEYDSPTDISVGLFNFSVTS